MRASSILGISTTFCLLLHNTCLAAIGTSNSKGLASAPPIPRGLTWEEINSEPADKYVEFVYRGDTRHPTEISQEQGFFPRGYKPKFPLDQNAGNPSLNFNLDDHLRGTTNPAYVSTSEKFGVAGEFAMGWQGGGKAYIYKIKTTPNMFPANALGGTWFKEQVEYPALGGIHWGQVEGWYEIDRVAEREDGRFGFPDTQPDPGKDRFYTNDAYQERVYGKSKHIRPSELTPDLKNELKAVLLQPPCRAGPDGGGSKRDAASCVWTDDADRLKSKNGPEGGNGGPSEPKPEQPKDGEVTESVTESELAELTEGELVETYQRFAEAEFTRMASAYGLSATMQRSQTPGGPSAYSRIRAKLKGYSQLTPEAIKLKIKGRFAKGGPAAFVAVGLVPWAVEMANVFTHQSTNWEQAAVVTSVMPIIGCVARIGANGEAGKGFGGDDVLCLATDALLLTPAWPVALAASLLKAVIEWIPNAIEANREFQRLRDEETLQQRRVDEWNKRQPKAYDHLKISLRRDEFIDNVKKQLQAETAALLFSGAQVAGGLHAGALQAATDAKQRGKIKADNLYPGGLPLNIQICAQFAARKARLRDDLVKEAHEAMRREQGSFDDYFFGKVKDFLEEHAPSPQGAVGVGSVVTPKQLADYADGVRSKRSLPPPFSDTQIASVQKIVDEALTWEPRACSGFCRQDDDLDCQWANCGPEPPTDQQVESNGLLHLFNDTAFGADDDSLSSSCSQSYGSQCFQQVEIARRRNYPVQPSKLLCTSRSKPANIDPAALAGTSSFLAVPDFNDFSGLFPDVIWWCSRSETCPIEPSPTADMILAKNIPGDESVRNEAIGLVSQGQHQGLFQDRPPQGWEACYSPLGLTQRNGIFSDAPAISEALVYIQENLTQGICKACYIGHREWVLACGLETAEWTEIEPTSTPEMEKTPEPALISAPITLEGNMVRVYALQAGKLVERISGRISGSGPTPPYGLSEEPFVGSPSAVSLGDPGREIRVYARNQAGELLEALGTPAGRWTGWNNLGGTISSDPFALALGDDDIRVYARNADSSLVERSYSKAKGWNTWATPEGLSKEPFVGSPSAILLGDSSRNIRVYARNQAGELLEASGTPAGRWTGWNNLGGTISSDPFAISLGDDNIRVYARDAAGSLVERSYSKAKGWSTWTTPEGLNMEPFVGSPTAIWLGDANPGGLGSGIRVYARNDAGRFLRAYSVNGEEWGGWDDLGVFERF